MKFILNKDTFEIEDMKEVKSGSVSYYEAEVEYDKNWKNLIIEAIMIKRNEDTGTSIAIINNKMHIDQKLKGTYQIGFVGYTLEGKQKTYQISTNLKSIYLEKGAGEIETENSELPTLTEWEIYIAQIDEMLRNSGSSGGGAIDDVRVDGVSVVENRIANISLYSLEKTLQDILTIIQGGELSGNQVADIEQLIVSYFENKTVKEVEE